ncbi:hypothetical protein C8J57DRAFT_1477182 [Mycena rebaudengoi]|nr:hypothetical protein C8J57DRAFT_1477182 [Mycena rebaudengoi]
MAFADQALTKDLSSGLADGAGKPASTLPRLYTAPHCTTGSPLAGGAHLIHQLVLAHVVITRCTSKLLPPPPELQLRQADGEGEAVRRPPRATLASSTSVQGHGLFYLAAGGPAAPAAHSVAAVRALDDVGAARVARGSQARAGSLELRNSARTANRAMTEDELVLNAPRAEDELEQRAEHPLTLAQMLYTFPQSVGIAGRRPILPRPAPFAAGGPTARAAHVVGALRVLDSEPPALRAGPLEPRAGSLEPARAASPLMTEAAFYQCAHAPAELRTFHSEKVRKTPLGGLDPSMLLGFVCRDEGEWVDLRSRIVLLPRTNFAIQDEPPTWPRADDDDMGLESVSDPEEEDNVDAYDGKGSMRFFDEGSSSASHSVASSAWHAHASTHYHSNSNSTTSSARTCSEEADTEDPVAPITPLPTTMRFDLNGGPKAQDGTGEKGTAGSPFPEEGDGFVDDDWVNPVPPPPVAAPAPVKKSKSASGKGREGREKKEKRSKTKKAAAVPVPSVHYPFPVSAEDGATGGGQQQQRAEERERQRNVTVSPRPAAQGRSEAAHAYHARAGRGAHAKRDSSWLHLCIFSTVVT